MWKDGDQVRVKGISSSAPTENSAIVVAGMSATVRGLAGAGPARKERSTSARPARLPDSCRHSWRPPSAQGCHPCLRYVSLPMSPVRTHILRAGGRWIRTLGPPAIASFVVGPRSLLRRAGGGEIDTAVQPDFFCSSSHCIDAGCHTVWAGCGWQRCLASSASRR